MTDRSGARSWKVKRCVGDDHLVESRCVHHLFEASEVRQKPRAQSGPGATDESRARNRRSLAWVDWVGDDAEVVGYGCDPLKRPYRILNVIEYRADEHEIKRCARNGLGADIGEAHRHGLHTRLKKLVGDREVQAIPKRVINSGNALSPGTASDSIPDQIAADVVFVKQASQVSRRDFGASALQFETDVAARPSNVQDPLPMQVGRESIVSYHGAQIVRALRAMPPPRSMVWYQGRLSTSAMSSPRLNA